MNARQNYLDSLTGLRFYAALAVFLSHLELFDYFLGVSDGAGFSFMKGLGALGVSLFFVLSGFVLYINYLSPGKQGKFSLRKFYIARFARIYPLFFVSTLCALPLVALSLDEPFLCFNLVANLTMLNTVFPSIGFINIPAWTINTEAFFYALFPFLALLFRGAVRRNFVMAFAGFVLFRVFTQSVFPHSEYLAADYFPPNRVFEFFTGMCLGYAYTHPSLRGVIQKTSWFISKSAFQWHILLATVILLMTLQPIVNDLLLNHLGFNPAPYAYYYYLPFSSIVIFLLALLERYQRAPALLLHPWILLGGEISYAFYLLHRPLMQYTVLLIGTGMHLSPTALPFPVGLLLGVLLFGFCCLVSYAAYRWIEKPCRQILRRGWKGFAQDAKIFSPAPKISSSIRFALNVPATQDNRLDTHP